MSMFYHYDNNDQSSRHDACLKHICPNDTSQSTLDINEQKKNVTKNLEKVNKKGIGDFFFFFFWWLMQDFSDTVLPNFCQLLCLIIVERSSILLYLTNVV